MANKIEQAEFKTRRDGFFEVQECLNNELEEVRLERNSLIKVGENMLNNVKQGDTVLLSFKVITAPKESKTDMFVLCPKGYDGKRIVFWSSEIALALEFKDN